MNTIAPPFEIRLFTRQNLLFLTLAVLLHLLALHGLDLDTTPVRAKTQENPIAVQFKDIPEQSEQKATSSQAKPGPLAAPKTQAVAPPKATRTVETVETAPAEPAPEKNPPPAEVQENLPVAPAENKAEIQAELATAPNNTVSKDSENKDGPQTYPIRIPQPGKISMRIVRTEPNRNPVYGDGEINWEFNNSSYKMSIVASLDLLLTSINLYQISSEGTIESYGITPTTSTEKRRNRSETATHFDHANKSVSFSSSNKNESIQDGAQDKASFIMQLAGIGNAEPEKFQAGREIRLQVAEERDISTFVFTVTGLEELDTKAGKIMAWHVVRPPRPGSYNSRLEIWLAPAMQWYPVQIRNTESNGAVTTQTATKVTITPKREN
ncbi:DUF3108 domain-containing protein [Undibacterium sp. Di27W]|uniref:DUF3108 domain-containing protein n=1 Tax=Undibacterium sp. Di27W TaxID=3413036 RepID=UPI003BF23486